MKILLILEPSPNFGFPLNYKWKSWSLSNLVFDKHPPPPKKKKQKEKKERKIKIYFYSVKVNLYLYSLYHFFHDIKICFYSTKMNLYLIKSIIICIFRDVKNIFYSIKINLHLTRNIYIIYFFPIQLRYIFIIWIFHSVHFLGAYLVFHLYLWKSEYCFQYVDWARL